MAEVFRPVPNVANAYVDSSYVPTIAGLYELQVGSTTTGEIGFDSTNPTTTAANMQARW